MSEEKEIIIDGVDVKICKHYDIDNNYCDQSYLGEGGLLKNTKNPKRCQQNPNCYFKQLKRLQEENKKLKNKNNDLIEEIASGNIDITILQKENEELKAKVKNYKLYGSSTVVQPYNHTNTEYDLLVLENEELKAKNKSIAKDYVGVFGDYQKYKQALEEIREITEENIIDCAGSKCEGMEEIQKLINEVLDDRN